jgi:phosphatidylglycerol lysyltransferase
MDKTTNNKPPNRFHTFGFWFKTILILSIIWLIYAFLQQGRVELPQLIHRLRSADVTWISIGVLLSGLFIFFQGEMYVWSFRSVEENVPRWVAIRLYLKRNFVSVFLPAGAVSSLATFSQSLENKGITKFKISIASGIYIISGVVTLWLIAVPVLIYTARLQQIDMAASISLGVLTGLLLLVVLFVISIKQKGKIYQFFTKRFPKIALQMDTFLHTPINIKALIATNIASILLEIIGILLLFVSIYAIGLDINWIVPCLAYTLSTLILYVAPIARGVGAVELSLIYVLTHNGIDANSALTVTLLYRFFGFWLPVLLGGVVFINRKSFLKMLHLIKN